MSSSASSSAAANVPSGGDDDAYAWRRDQVSFLEEQRSYGQAADAAAVPPLPADVTLSKDDNNALRLSPPAAVPGPSVTLVRVPDSPEDDVTTSTATNQRWPQNHVPPQLHRLPQPPRHRPPHQLPSQQQRHQRQQPHHQQWTRGHDAGRLSPGGLCPTAAAAASLLTDESVPDVDKMYLDMITEDFKSMVTR